MLKLGRHPNGKPKWFRQDDNLCVEIGTPAEDGYDWQTMTFHEARQPYDFSAEDHEAIKALCYGAAFNPHSFEGGGN